MFERQLVAHWGYYFCGIFAVRRPGMGDSCFNEGMQSITQAISSHVKAYAVCVPTGDNQMSDTINGFLLSMDKSVDVFAQKIQADVNLKNGFNAVGFSQVSL